MTTTSRLAGLLRAPVGASGVVLFLLSLLFVLWSIGFILQTSVLCWDGQRAYSLFDDAMIGMRYAWNLAHGDGLVWNPGERVEGFTDLLMVLVRAIPCLFLGKSAAVLAVQLGGIGILLGVAFINRLIACEVFAREREPGAERRKKGGRRWPGIMGFAAPLLYYPLVYWGLMGMETALLALLLLGAVLTALRCQGDLSFRPLFPLLLGLAYLTRMDALIPGAILFGWRWMGGARTARERWALTGEAAVLGAFVAGMALFRWSYYGELVPNTYHLKVAGIPLAYRIFNGWEFLHGFFAATWPALALGAIGLSARFCRETVLIATLLIASLAYTLWAGGDAWPMWRMTAPFIPLFLLLVMLAGEAISRLLPSPGRCAPWLAGGALLLALAWADRPFYGQMSFRDLPFQVGWNRVNVNRGVMLREIATPDAVMAVAWAGAIPYYAGFRAHDLLGKCDSVIARLPVETREAFSRGKTYVPGHVRYDFSYSIDRLKPDFTEALSIDFGFTASTASTPSARMYRNIALPIPEGGVGRFLFRVDSPRVKRNALALLEGRQVVFTSR